MTGLGRGNKGVAKPASGNRTPRRHKPAQRRFIIPLDLAERLRPYVPDSEAGNDLVRILLTYWINEQEQSYE